MKAKLLVALTMLAGTSLFARSHVTFGVAIGGGGYYAPAPVYVAPPVAYVDPDYAYDEEYIEPCPTPGYIWTPGYSYYSGPRRLWRAGFWGPPAVGFGYSSGYYGRGYSGGGYYGGRSYYGGRGFVDRGYYNRGYSDRGYSNRGYSNRGYSDRGNSYRGNSGGGHYRR